MRRSLVIASVAKQSPAWNKYSNFSVLMPEIATLVNSLAMTCYQPVIAAFPLSLRASNASEAIPCMEQVQ